MTLKIIILLGVITLLPGCINERDSRKTQQTTSPEAAKALTTLRLTPVFPGVQFTQPLAMEQTPDKNWIVAEQGGRLFLVSPGKTTKTLFLDLRDQVKTGSEMGLLGFCLASDFENSGIFYVSYTNHGDFSIISRMRSSNYRADPISEEILLKIKQPYGNHNGGQINFGPDGYLYIGLGDGGWFGDPDNNAQNTNTLLGSMLRIDVSQKGPYAIPPDNPFVGKTGRDEIFAYGLRNPWRWSFDRQTGVLWAADVGQNHWEEIDIIRKGGNYGWNILEGSHCYKTTPCDAENTILPVWEYNHGLGQAITGGFVYRGKKIPALQGYYVYADFGSGKVWALQRKPDLGINNILLFESGLNPSSFGQDMDGELYLIDYNGEIYAITKT